MIPEIPDKFSKYRSIIERRYSDDETFREIYIDYQTYLDALQFWKQSAADEAPARRSEYATLVRELEEELADILKKEGR